MEKNACNNQNQVIDSVNEPKAEHKFIFIVITIITLLFSLYGKALTMGWITVLLTWLAIMPIHFILFTISGIQLAKVKNKDKFDYISFLVLCATMLLYAYTFVDVGDVQSSKVIYSIDEGILFDISFACFLINIFLIIMSIVRCSIKKRKTEKKG